MLSLLYKVSFTTGWIVERILSRISRQGEKQLEDCLNCHYKIIVNEAILQNSSFILSPTPPHVPLISPHKFCQQEQVLPTRQYWVQKSNPEQQRARLIQIQTQNFLSLPRRRMVRKDDRIQKRHMWLFLRIAWSLHDMGGWLDNMLREAGRCVHWIKDQCAHRILAAEDTTWEDHMCLPT